MQLISESGKMEERDLKEEKEGRTRKWNDMCVSVILFAVVFAFFYYLLYL